MNRGHCRQDQTYNVENKSKDCTNVPEKGNRTGQSGGGGGEAEVQWINK